MSETVLPRHTGVSLLGCPKQWLPPLTELTQSNPRIMSIEILNSIASLSESEARIEENRCNWGTNTPIPDGDRIVSCFCFSSNFTAKGAYMSKCSRRATGILLVKTVQAGTFRVTFLHHSPWGPILSWSLRTTESPLQGTIEIPAGRDFRSDGFTFEVPSAGLHQIDIRIDNRGFYGFRKVWVTLVHGDTQVPGDTSDAEGLDPMALMRGPESTLAKEGGED
ncbi:hypothetical protein FB451DRAFT_1171146 [Mycena latifolia]|nr:hypothetical protein FB451DRAFT_1171146 [Mycena latifolia]